MGALIAAFIYALFSQGFTPFEKGGDNYFEVLINSQSVGFVADPSDAEELFTEARRNLSKDSEELVFIDASLETKGKNVIWGAITKKDELIDRISGIMQDNIKNTLQHAYVVRVDDYTAELGELDEVYRLLQEALNKYGALDKYDVELKKDTTREFNVLTAEVFKKENASGKNEALMSGGIANVFVYDGNIEQDAEDMRFSEFELGLKDIFFQQKVEIAEEYVNADCIKSFDEVVNEVVKDQETPSEYEVVSGDTLSEIAIKVDIPMDDIVAMNPDLLNDTSSTIRVGDKLIITVPKPELSVIRTQEEYVEEIYDADIIYIDNDDWYTTEQKLLQQPSAGFHRAIVDVTYENDKIISRDVIKQEVVMEAVPKIVERGTKIPPTYIKPISGGRLTSGFGKRSRPTKGASSYHKGVDWATPKGTPVYASCGGTVAKAGWGSGYGYVVYINHPDGRQTRYGHLSKILVSDGQTVKQGDKIALSGNTGVSTGPHVHFEILINGSQVNPLNYLN